MVVTEFRAAAPRLLLFGVQDYSLHCAQLAISAGWEVHLIDHRPAFAAQHRVPDGAHLHIDHPADTAAELMNASERGWTAACVMTHLPELDVPVLDTLLRADPGPDFLGALGSHPAQQRRRSALTERGHTPTALEQIRGPLGVDIAAASPAESAVSIFAELIMAKNSGSDSASAATQNRAPTLSRSAGPIHRGHPREASILHRAQHTAEVPLRQTELAGSS